MAIASLLIKIGADISSMETKLKQVESSVQKTGKKIEQAFSIGSFAKMAGTFSVVQSAIGLVTGELEKFISIGSQLPAVEASFLRLSTGMQQSSAGMLAALTASTRGLVSNYDLMLSANKAMLLGLPVTESSMGELAAAATTLGRAMGQDATTSLNDLIVALGRSSPMILDNLGLSVKVGEANEKYAATLKKTAEQLTDAEKKMAFYTAAMAAARDKTAQLGESTKTLGEIAQTVWTSVGNVVSGTVASINVGLGSTLSDLRGFAMFAGDVMTKGFAVATMMAGFRAQLAALPAEHGKVAKAATDHAAAVEKVDAAYTKWLDKQQALFEKEQDIAKRLFGTDTINKAVEYVRALGDVANVTRMTTEGTAEFNAVMAAGVESLVLRGRAASDLARELSHLRDITSKLTSLPGQEVPLADITAIPKALPGLTDPAVLTAFDAETQRLNAEMQGLFETTATKATETASTIRGQFTTAFADIGNAANTAKDRITSTMDAIAESVFNRQSGISFSEGFGTASRMNSDTLRGAGLTIPTGVMPASRTPTMGGMGFGMSVTVNAPGAYGLDTPEGRRHLAAVVGPVVMDAFKRAGGRG